MKTTAVYLACLAVYLLPFFSEIVNAASESANGSIGSDNAIAKVIKVTPGEDNDWMVAVKDPKSPTGYAIKVKDTIYESFFKNYFLVAIFSRKNPTDKLEIAFLNRICYLLDPKDDYYPADNYMPRQIIDIILPGRYGSCNIDNTTVAIEASGPVNTDPKAKEVTLPASSPYELVVNIVPMKYVENPDTKYWIQVVFAVGGNFKVSGSVGGSTGGKNGSKAGASVTGG